MDCSVPAAPLRYATTHKAGHDGVS